MKKAKQKRKDEIIEPPPKESSKAAYSFTRLCSRVIRKLLALNSDLEVKRRSGGCIPTRFEVIIDLNLDYPGWARNREGVGNGKHRPREESKSGSRMRSSGFTRRKAN